MKILALLAAALMLQGCLAHRSLAAIEAPKDAPVVDQLQQHEAAARRAVVAQALSDLSCNSPELVGLGSDTSMSHGADTLWHFRVNACDAVHRYDAQCSTVSALVGCEVNRVEQDVLAEAR